MNFRDELIINENLSSLFSDLYEERWGADFTIVLTNRVIHAHRCILRTAIPYFKAMFSSGLAEKDGGKVILQEIDSDATELTIRYAYTGKLTITRDNWQALLVAADFLQFQNIIDYCYKYVKRRINFEVISQVNNFSILPNFPKLIKIVDDFLTQRFEDICKESEFFNLTFETMLRIISSNDLRVRSELDTFHYLIKWVKHDPSSRKQYLAQLFKALRLQFISKDNLTVFISREPLITEDEECNNYYQQALIKSPPSDPLDRCFPGETINIVDDTLISGYRAELPRVRPFSPKRLDIYSEITCYSDVILKNSFYIIGGWSEGRITDRLEIKYHRGTDGLGRRANIASLNFARSSSAAIVVDQKIYVCGGMDGEGQALGSVECYNPEENKWLMQSPMRRKRFGHAVEELNDQIYAIGGYQERSVERYDPGKNVWIEIAPMDKDRVYAAAAVYKGKIFISGGISGGEAVNDTEVYDPNIGTWVTIDSMMSSRYYHYLINYDSKLFAVGGKDHNNEYSNKLEELKLDPEGDNWYWGEYEPSRRDWEMDWPLDYASGED